MKKLFALTFMYINVLSSIAQNINPNLDTLLAKKLEADEYGMKMYSFVILKSGNNKSTNKNFKDSCFAGHMQNIRKLAANKQLIVAGPFTKNDADLRGLFILNVKNNDEANQLLASDPAIKNDFLKAEIFPWYGSAALSEYLTYHDKIWKINP
ncbi:MAG TPA: YciI family protein [Bacteroidia bacterium]|nr:YciI family protein [Bacteroidia bacterium]